LHIPLPLLLQIASLCHSPQLGHVSRSKSQISSHGVQPIPQDVHQLVSLLHNSSHYIVLEIDIPGRIFKNYDGLSRELIQWMDHIVLALKKYMLMDVSYASSNTNTIIIPDAGALPAVSHSRRPEKSINGYSITFPWCPLFDKICQPWQLERGYFIHQKNGFNFGPIACLKFMEIYGIISIPEPQAFYNGNNICRIIMRQ
jgi:hypothetical protein